MGWDKDRKLEFWQSNGLTLIQVEDYLVYEKEVLEYRRRLPANHDSHKIYFNSIEQIESRIKWLENQQRVQRTSLYKIINKVVDNK